MTREEAGRKGGEKVAEEHGSEFYREIGRKVAKVEETGRQEPKVNLEGSGVHKGNNARKERN
jgi:uncharacterized protein